MELLRFSRYSHLCLFSLLLCYLLIYFITDLFQTIANRFIHALVNFINNIITQNKINFSASRYSTLYSRNRNILLFLHTHKYVCIKINVVTKASFRVK